MATLQTVPSVRLPRTYPRRPSVADGDKVREDRIRADMRKARLRMRASCQAQAAALGKSHVAIVDRRNGRGPDALLALEVDAYERAGISTDPILNGLRAVQLAARHASLADHEVLSRLDTLLADEHDREARENAAVCRFHASGSWRTLVDGVMPETDCQTEIVALAMVAEARGLVWRAR